MPFRVGLLWFFGLRLFSLWFRIDLKFSYLLEFLLEFLHKLLIVPQGLLSKIVDEVIFVFYIT